MVFISAVNIGDGDCYALQSFHTNPESSMLGSVVLFVTLLVDIMFCILTLRNIRKKYHSVGIMMFTTKSNPTIVCQRGINLFATPSLQTKLKNKRHALVVVLFVVVTHAVTYLARIVMIIFIRLDTLEINSMNDIFILFNFLTFIFDAIFCIISVRPLREIFTRNFI